MVSCSSPQALIASLYGLAVHQAQRQKKKTAQVRKPAPQCLPADGSSRLAGSPSRKPNQ
jgi:ABC-type uncharacterized transport system auxiliary subunit